MKNIAGSGFVALLAAAALSLATLASFAADDPLLGTWVLNASKSKGAPGSLPDSSTVVVTDAGGGKYKAVSDTAMAGANIHGEITFAFDGADYTPVTTPAGPPGVSITQSAEKLSPASYKSSIKMNGAEVVTALNEVSADGKTLTVTSTGVGIAAGTSSVTVFDRK